MTVGLIRRAEVIIGPLADWQGSGGGEGIRIVANGSNTEGLRVAFSITKTITGEPNRLSMAITNLSLSTRQQIRQGLTRVQVSAGYENDPNGLVHVASGGILSAISQKSGPDTNLIISAFDGYGGMLRSSFARSFAGNSPLSEVVRQIAASMPGVVVGRVDVGNVTLYRKGQHFTGRGPDLLNRLADQYGFSWSVQDGVFQALSDGKSTGSVFDFQSGDNLLCVTPVLNGPLQAKIGVRIDAQFSPSIKPGDRANVLSTVSPDLSGQYLATTVSSDFDSHGGASTVIESLSYF